MAKRCKECWCINENPLLKYCMEHADKNKKLQSYKPLVQKTPLKPWLPPKKIWEKRKNRIKEQGSEYKVFVEIWKEREHICDNCWKWIKFFDPSCFAHKLNKRDNQKLRYDKKNIALVHWVFETMDDTGKTYNCHKEYDLKFKTINKTYEKH